MTIRFALLGAGRIGKTHAKAISDNAQAQLACVYDLFEEAAQSVSGEYDCDIRGIDEIAADPNIDAVAICTPTNTHADLIEKFSHAGKAIFCEKPIDLSLARVKECLATAQEQDAKLMIGFNRRFDPHFQALKKGLDAGEIGKIEQVIITSRDPSPPPVSYIDVSGGIFRDMTIHDFDLARFMLGEEITHVYASGSVLVDPEIGEHNDYDTATVVMRTATGKQAVITNSRRASYGYDQRVEVHGEKGMLSAHNPKPVTLEKANIDGYHTQPLHDFFMTRYIEAYAAEIHAFVQMLTQGQEASPSGRDGLIALALADAATLSAASGQEIKVDM